MKTRVATLAALLTLAIATTVSAQEQMAAQPGVAESAIATQVADRQPVDNVTSVPADVGRVYCWTRIVGAQGEVEVVHVWYHGDMEMARVPLRVGSDNWRTWSSKNIEPSWTGQWRVDVEAPDGTVIQSMSFTVG